MGKPRNMHSRYEKCVQNFVGNPEGKDHVGDVGIYGTVLLKYT
jgi:hypothetical protein